MPIGYLYVTTNDVNEYVYAGQSRRLDQHSIDNYLGSGDFLTPMIAELGVEHFTKQVLGYYDDPSELDYAEVLLIAELRVAGTRLLNGSPGGPRAHAQFLRSMFEAFGVAFVTPGEWYEVVKANPDQVKKLLADGHTQDTDEFYRDLERQFRVTQDLRRDCPSCGSEAGTVCRTKTGNPAKNHSGRNRLSL